MADTNERFNVSPLAWSVVLANTHTVLKSTYVPPDGEIYFFRGVTGFGADEDVSLVGDGAQTLVQLAAKAFSDAKCGERYFIPSRVDSQELPITATLSTPGWYTIAYSYHSVSSSPARGEISVCSSAGRGSTVRVGCRPATTARTRKNSFIRFVDFFETGDAPFLYDVVGYRIVKSDSVETAGFKVQMKIASARAYTIQLRGNLSSGDAYEGLKLITPYLDNTPNCPDGSTVGTFIEAGADMSFDSPASFMFPDFIATRVTSDDVLRCTVLWPEIPKQGTGLSITLPSGSLSFRMGDGTSSTNVTTGATVSSFGIVGKHVMFNLTQTGIASGMSVAPAAAFFSGSGGKLAITG